MSDVTGTQIMRKAHEMLAVARTSLDRIHPGDDLDQGMLDLEDVCLIVIGQRRASLPEVTAARGHLARLVRDERHS